MWQLLYDSYFSPAKNFIGGNKTSTDLVTLFGNCSDTSKFKSYFREHPEISINSVYNSKTILLQAICERNMSLVNYLLKHRQIDVNFAPPGSNTPLTTACDLSWKQCIDSLLDNPYLDVNHPHPTTGNTALHHSTLVKATESVKSLLQHPQLLINKQNSTGETALHLACKHNCSKIVRALTMKEGIYINRKTHFSQDTPLHIAVQFKSHQAMLALLQSEPHMNSLQINPINSLGFTPLAIAVQNKDLFAIALLLIDYRMLVDLLKISEGIPYKFKPYIHTCIMKSIFSVYTFFNRSTPFSDSDRPPPHVIPSVYNHLHELISKGSPNPPPDYYFQWARPWHQSSTTINSLHSSSIDETRSKGSISSFASIPTSGSGTASGSDQQGAYNHIRSRSHSHSKQTSLDSEALSHSQTSRTSFDTGDNIPVIPERVHQSSLKPSSISTLWEILPKSPESLNQYFHFQGPPSSVPSSIRTLVFNSRYSLIFYPSLLSLFCKSIDWPKLSTNISKAKSGDAVLTSSNTLKECYFLASIWAKPDPFTALELLQIPSIPIPIRKTAANIFRTHSGFTEMFATQMLAIIAETYVGSALVDDSDQDTDSNVNTDLSSTNDGETLSLSAALASMSSDNSQSKNSIDAGSRDGDILSPRATHGNTHIDLFACSTNEIERDPIVELLIERASMSTEFAVKLYWKTNLALEHVTIQTSNKSLNESSDSSDSTNLDSDSSISSNTTSTSSSGSSSKIGRLWKKSRKIILATQWKILSLLLTKIKTLNTFATEIAPGIEWIAKLQEAHSIIIENSKGSSVSQIALIRLALGGFSSSEFSVRIPLWPNVHLVKFIPEHSHVFQSAMRPWLLSTSDENGDTRAFILKKGDDMRQDGLAVQLLEMIHQILIKNHLDCRLGRYQAIALGPIIGVAQAIPNVKTLTDLLAVKKKLKSKENAMILYWKSAILSSQNLDPTDEKLYENVVIPDDVFHRYVYSVAGASVFNYLLGIGDRHNENILVSTDGTFYHIDFGFLFGRDPKFHIPIKLTQSMVNAMPDFDEFLEICCQAFNILRLPENKHMIMTTVHCLSNSGLPDLSSSRIQKMSDRFKSHLSEEESNIYFKKLIQSCINSKKAKVSESSHTVSRVLKKLASR